MVGLSPKRPRLDVSGWKNMPKPRPIMTLSWEDVTTKAEDLGIGLTRAQVIEIFEGIADRGPSETAMEDKWHSIKEWVEEYRADDDEEDED